MTEHLLRKLIALYLGKISTPSEEREGLIYGLNVLDERLRLREELKAKDAELLRVRIIAETYMQWIEDGVKAGAVQTGWTSHPQVLSQLKHALHNPPTVVTM